MKISVIAEGKTEKAFISHLRTFLEPHLTGKMPTLSPNIYNGRIPTGDKLKRRVDHLLNGSNPSDHVIALTDVYTGANQNDFSDASDAKQKMRTWVGQEPRFHPPCGAIRFRSLASPILASNPRIGEARSVRTKREP